MQEQFYNSKKPPESTKTPEKHTKKDYENAKAEAEAKNEEMEKKEALENKVEEVAEKFMLTLLFKFSKKHNEDYNKITESDFKYSNIFSSLVKEKIDIGYEFIGFEEDGLIWKWKKNSEEIEEENPFFLQKNIQGLLSKDLQNKVFNLKKEQENKELKEKVHTEFWYIVEELLEKGAIGSSFFSKDLSIRQINAVNNSDFKKEITAVLIENIKAEKDGREAFYEIEVTKKGVRFIASKEFKEEGGKDVEFNVKDYDKKLNYPKETKIFETKEPEVKEEMSKEELYKRNLEEFDKHQEKWKKIKEIKEEMPEYQEVEDLFEEYKDAEQLDETEVWGMAEKTTELTDSIAEKTEGFELLNEDIKSMIPKIIEAIKIAKENGEDPKDAIYNIEGFEDIGNKMAKKRKEIGESGDLEQEAALSLYGGAIENMIDFTLAKYKPSETE